jgi:predicted amidohydrolase
MTDSVRVAAVQMDVHLGALTDNMERVLRQLERAAADGAQLVVFPECALSGYCFTSLAEALPYALRRDAPLLRAFASRCTTLGVTGVLGFLEQQGDACANSALIVAPNHPPACYVKTHLPTLGVDRFVTAGDALPVHPAPFGTLGTLICYDVRFPEAARTLGLQGADILALPTNWPQGAETAPEFITRTRAWESRMFVVAADRVGVERGRRFLGRSQIVAPTGQILQEAGGEEETILVADLDLTLARQKRIVLEAGEWELDITHDRRPALYGTLTRTPS